MYTRISAGWEDLGCSIIRFHERDDFVRPTSPDEEIWVLKDVWTTLNGSWEQNSDGTRPGIWACPQWARDTYLLPWAHECYFSDAGGDHHVFGAIWPNAVESNVGCDLDKEAVIIYWSDDRDVPMSGDVQVKVKQHWGWANVVMYTSSNFDPDIQHGPWRWQPSAVRCDIAIGAGMPWNHHVSFFGCWANMTWEQYQKEIMNETPPVEPPVEPPDDGVLARLSYNVERLTRFVVDGERT